MDRFIHLVALDTDTHYVGDFGKRNQYGWHPVVATFDNAEKAAEFAERKNGIGVVR